MHHFSKTWSTSGSHPSKEQSKIPASVHVPVPVTVPVQVPPSGQWQQFIPWPQQQQQKTKEIVQNMGRTLYQSLYKGYRGLVDGIQNIDEQTKKHKDPVIEQTKINKRYGQRSNQSNQLSQCYKKETINEWLDIESMDDYYDFNENLYVNQRNKHRQVHQRNQQRNKYQRRQISGQWSQHQISGQWSQHQTSGQWSQHQTSGQWSHYQYNQHQHHPMHQQYHRQIYQKEFIQPHHHLSKIQNKVVYSDEQDEKILQISKDDSTEITHNDFLNKLFVSLNNRGLKRTIKKQKNIANVVITRAKHQPYKIVPVSQIVQNQNKVLSNYETALIYAEHHVDQLQSLDKFIESMNLS